jgi:acyl-CoA thioesterase
MTQLDLTVASGLEQVRAVQAGILPRPGIAGLVGFELSRVDPGDVEATLETRADMTNPMGSVHGGVAATLLDTVMGCAVHTVLDAGESYTTTDLHVHYVRGVHPGKTIVATGTVVHRGRRLATAEGRILDERGRVVAPGTPSCMVFPAPRP